MVKALISACSSIICQQFTPLRMHPLFHAMYALMIGIAIGRACFWAPAALTLTISATIAGGVCFALLRGYKHGFTPTLLTSVYIACALLLGIIRIQQRMNNFYSSCLYISPSVTLEGTIIDHTPVEHPLIKDSITIHVDRIIDGTPRDAHGMMIKLYCARAARVCVADRIRIENVVLKQPKKDEFTWYLIKEGISSTIFTPSYKGTLIERPQRSLSRYLDEIRSKTLKGVCSSLDRATQALYASLFLGNRSSKKDELDKVADEFRTWGISHYLARSGLHMVIFASLWNIFLNLLPLDTVIKALLLCIITGLYATLSWSSISFIRALSAFLAYKLYSVFSIPAHSIHVFSLVCVFVLIDNPAQLFFLDFQLSFGLTFGIAWFYHTYGAYMRRLKSMQYARTVE